MDPKLLVTYFHSASMIQFWYLQGNNNQQAARAIGTTTVDHFQVDRLVWSPVETLLWIGGHDTDNEGTQTGNHYYQSHRINIVSMLNNQDSWAMDPKIQTLAKDDVMMNEQGSFVAGAPNVQILPNQA